MKPNVGFIWDICALTRARGAPLFASAPVCAEIGDANLTFSMLLAKHREAILTE